MSATETINEVLEGKQLGASICGDAYDLLNAVPNASIDLILTSPPYWGLRDYEQEHNWEILSTWNEQKVDGLPSYDWYRENGGLLGLEPLPEWYVHNVSSIADRLWRVLRPGGSFWLNIGDTYFARWASIRSKGRQGMNGDERQRRKTPMGGFRQEKQLLLIPSRVAISMQERRWILRNDLIWYKPNTIPRAFDDRLINSHEHFFHFVKRPTQGRAKYYYERALAGDPAHDVHIINAEPGKDAHSATFPEKLIEPRIISSCPENGIVLDPFSGTGTTLRVALNNSRRAIGFDLNPRFVKASNERLTTINHRLFS